MKNNERGRSTAQYPGNHTAEGDDMMTKWLTEEQACEYLQVSEAALLRWRGEGKLKAYKLSGQDVIRYRQEDIDALMQPLQQKNVMGTIIDWDEKYGSGHIRPDGSDEEFFMSYKGITAPNQGTISIGTRARFDVEETDEGPVAKNVRIEE